jgi:hypothetical protein
MNDKPGKITTIGIMTVVSGVLNILWGLGLTVTVVLGTLGIGLICAPLTILPAILGIFEIIYAIKVLANPPQPLQPSSAIAILEIITILSGNVISAAVGIVALVLYNDEEVKQYFASIN